MPLDSTRLSQKGWGEGERGVADGAKENGVWNEGAETGSQRNHKRQWVWTALTSTNWSTPLFQHSAYIQQRECAVQNVYQFNWKHCVQVTIKLMDVRIKEDTVRQNESNQEISQRRDEEGDSSSTPSLHPAAPSQECLCAFALCHCLCKACTEDEKKQNKNFIV